MYRTLALAALALTTMAEPLEILNSPRVERFTNTLLGMDQWKVKVGPMKTWEMMEMYGHDLRNSCTHSDVDMEVS